MSPLQTILIVSVAVAAISIGLVLLDEVFAKLDRRRRHDDVATMLHELPVIDSVPRAAAQSRRSSPALATTIARARAREWERCESGAALR